MPKRQKSAGLKSKIRLIQKDLAKISEISKDEITIREIILDLHNNLDRGINDLILLKLGIDPLNATSQNFSDIFGNISFYQKIKWIGKMGMIDSDIFNILKEINITRNGYAHGKEGRRYYRKKRLTFITLINLLYKDYKKSNMPLIQKRIDLQEECEVLRGGFTTSVSCGEYGTKEYVINNMKDLKRYREEQNELIKMVRSHDKEKIKRFFAE